MKKITITANEEYQVKILDKIKDDEFFYSSFKKAKRELEDIITKTKEYWNEEIFLYYNKRENIHNNYKNTLFDFSNNIIAFTGNRGQGKSSAMLSFSNFLKHKNTSSNSSFLGKEICENNFTILDRIDPTKFENNDNILLIILAKIFDDFCLEWEKSEKKEMSIYSELLDMFQSCYSEILTIKTEYFKHTNEYSLGNELEQLGRIGDSGNLKKHLWELIQKFFEFKNRSCNYTYIKHNNFLVIQLDDTDLNIKKAYNIVEDVRKYFMIPNVIILMAIDVKQLTKAIEQNFINNFEKINTFYQESQYNNHNEHYKIAVKYIDKLIPGNRKIILPKITPDTDEYGERVELEYLSKSQDGILINTLDFKNKNTNKVEDIQKLVLRYIYEKTGLVFVKPNTYVHDIIPETMRELVNFLSVLYDMKSVKNDYTDSEDLKIRINNLESFESFFVEVWIPNYISKAYLDIVQRYINASWVTKNKQLIKDILVVFSSVFYEHSNTNRKLNLKFRYFENKDTFSLADIRKILMILEDELPQKETYKFTFAIKTLYSIYMNKIICNQMIHECLGEEYDNELLLDFLGGEIFGDEAINFVRTDDNLYKRGIFDINAYINTEAKDKIKNIIEADPIIPAIFGNFCFSSTQYIQQEYKTPYKAANGTNSNHYKFNISKPILYLTYPIPILERIESLESYNHSRVREFPHKMNFIRYQCMRIVSNLELINYISKNLKKLANIRIDQWSFDKHLINMYQRIEKCINELEYYCFDNDWSDFIMFLEKHSSSLNDLYNLYRTIEKTNAELKYDKEYRLRMRINQIPTLRNTKTFENLKGKVDGLLSSLKQLNKLYDDDMLFYFILQLQELSSEIDIYSGPMDNNNRVQYQGEYNRIVRDLKNEFVK